MAPVTASHSINISFVSLLLLPIGQFIILLALCMLVVCLLRPTVLDRLWVIGGIHYLLFILVNVSLCWFADSGWLYFLYSLLLSALFLIGVNGIIQVYARWRTVTGSGESSMIFLVIIYHPILLLFVMLIRWMIDP